MSVNLRMDETVTFTIQWVDSLGNAVTGPSDGAAWTDHPEFVHVDDLGGGTYKVTPLGQVPDPGVKVGVSGEFVAATDDVVIQGGVPVGGTVVWGTPEPAVV